METVQFAHLTAWAGQRLNRTMQYGNKKETNINKREVQGLNRTMQYGNRKMTKTTQENKKV